jgi:hypothetical protein
MSIGGAESSQNGLQAIWRGNWGERLRVTGFRLHTPAMDLVFLRFSGDGGSSPGSNGSVLNHAPFSPMRFMAASSAK